MLRFALRPRWLATHALVLAVVVLFVNLGFWQLRRLDERRDRNELVEEQSTLPAEPVAELVAAAADVDDLRFRATTAAGTVEGVATVRANEGGAPGFHVLAAVDLGEGSGVAVLVGFAGPAPDGGPPDAGPEVGDRVDVTGVAVPLRRTSSPLRREVDGLADRTGLALLGVLVQAVDAADPLEPVALPDLDEGPHLGYAVQWFLFAGVVVVGYPFLLRRRARGG
jgi:cytochrome oxidase assembly protein ShyY1